MRLPSPIVAILWETWRVTRVETAWKLVLGMVGGLAVLALCTAIAPADNAKAYAGIMDGGAAGAMILLVLPHLVSWQSLAKLNGGRPGFPLYLNYSRPVRTAVLVGLPMAYLTGVSLAIYLVSALVLRVYSGFVYPLLTVAAWIAALTLVLLAATWSTRNKTVQIVVMASAVVKGLGMAMDRLTAVEIPDTFDWPPRLWPTLFDFPRSDYAWIALIGIAAFGVTLAAVARQRRGEAWPEVPSVRGGGFWAWLVNLFRFPCPTSSATRAQVWFDLKSDGLPLLTIGVALAILILLLSAVSGNIDAAINADPGASCPIKECFYVRAFPPLLAPLSMLIILYLGGNAFGIRQKQGRTYLSTFEATRAHGTAQLALLKVLVKSACVLAAIIAIGVGVWLSLPLLGDAVFIQMWNVPLSTRLPAAINGAVAALSGYEQLALAIVAAVGLVVLVAALAVLAALWTRYPRRLIITALSLLLLVIALMMLALAEPVSPSVSVAIFAAVRWLLPAAMALTTVYVFWSGFAERVLTVRYASSAVAISAAFAGSWLTLRHGLSAIDAASMLWAMLLPLMVSVLAPWSLNRLRHI